MPTTTTKPVARKRRTSKKPAGLPPQAREDAAKMIDSLKSPALEEFGRNLAGFISGGNEIKASAGASAGGMARVGDGNAAPGLELDDLSILLARREGRGYERGHGDGYRAGRRAMGVAVRRERQESVAGTLLFVTRQLADVAERLAAREKGGLVDAVADKQARLEFVETLAEMSRQAQRLASGEDELDGAGGAESPW